MPKSKAKKRGPKKSFEILIVNKQVKRTGIADVTVNSSAIGISFATAETLKIREGDYILLGLYEKRMFFGKKPVGMFGGHKLSKGSNNTRLLFSCKTSAYGLTPGHYSVGESYSQPMEGEHGKELTATMWEMIPIDGE